MALVLLPCDLPTWPTVQRYFAQLKLAKNANEVVELMYKLHNLCCIGLDSDEDNYADSQRFKVFHSFLETVLSDEERKQFFDVILPNLVESAVNLKSLKPVNGLLYSLQQQAEQFNIDRKLIQSLLSHAFFSTFPKRSVKTHPTLQNFNFSEFFNHLDNLHQQAKLRSFLRYFEIISTDEIFSQGNIQFSRQVTPNWKSRSLEEWLTCDLPLCPLTVHHEGGIEDFKGDAVRVCFASSRIGGELLTDGCNQEEINFSTCPELAVSLLFVEKLEENEVMIVRNLVRIGSIQDGKKFVISENSSATCDNYLCLIDAENYERDSSIQYREPHILRELLKAFAGFQQTMDSRRLSPLGKSCTTPPPEMWYSVCGVLEHDKSELDTANTVNINTQRRPTLIGQSFNSLVESKGLSSPDEKKLTVPGLESKGRLLSQESEAEYKDAVSYPWHMQQSTIGESDDVWFTPMEPPKVNLSQLSSAEEATKLNRVFNKPSIESILSDEEYQSCDEDENPGVAIPKIEAGPVASSGRVTLVSQRPPPIKRNLSSQSQSDTSRSFGSQESDKTDDEDGQLLLHRVPSTGFLLDEEDYFVGDGLEAEQEWLRQFRNRSMSRSVSGISRRNSSRYSFSSDFSSDLDDIYEHFEEMMAKGPVTDDPQVAKYVGGILKRTLSDSLTAARQRCAEGEVMPRSLSLADHLTQERRSLERAKQVGFSEAAGEGVSAEKSGKRKLSGNLVSIVIEQSLAEVEEKLAFEMHKDKADAIRKTLGNLYSQISANNLPTKTDVEVESKREDVKITSGNNSVVSLNIIAPDDDDSESSRSARGIDESGDCRSIEDDDDSEYNAGGRRSVSEPDLRFFSCDSSTSPELKNPDFLRKWNATSNLFDGGLLSPSSTPTHMRQRSNSSAIRTQSLESLCTRFWDSGRNSDSDQFWLVFDTRQSSLEDVLSVGEEENPPRRRVKSFSTPANSTTRDSQILKRASSDPALSPKTLTERVEEVDYLMKKEQETPIATVTVTGRTGILADHYSPLQVIAEVPHEEISTPDLSNKINFVELFSTSVRPSIPRDDESLVIRNDDSKSKTSDWDSHQNQRIETPVNIHGYKSVVTGNWGCGRLKGNPQLKALIQWMAASRAEIPTLIYFTQRNQHVVKLDIINRILLDRHWTVGTLIKVLMNYCNQRVDDNSICLFDAILPRDSH